MGRKTRNRHIVADENFYNSDEEYYKIKNDNQYNKIKNDIENKIKKIDGYWEFLNIFDDSTKWYTDFYHLEILGPGYVYNTIINECRHYTPFYTFPPDNSINKYKFMNEYEKEFWENILNILGKDKNKAQSIHNLLSIK
jgi:hypothetical protein